MGIWRQRIEGTWLKCTGTKKFRIMNLKGGYQMDDFITGISLKHKSIDFAFTNNTFNYGDQILQSKMGGVMYDEVGLNTTYGTDIYSYIIDYYFGPAITSKKSFISTKNYQFKTHAINFAYIDDRTSLNNILRINTEDPNVVQPNMKLYNSELNCFKGSLGINPSWEDTYFFDPPYYSTNFDMVPKNSLTPTTVILYYYSTPKEDTDSGFFSYTNKLKKSSAKKPGETFFYKIGTQSVYQATYALSGVEVNETGWKIQGYSQFSYDNDPGVGDYVVLGAGITNSYSGPVTNNQVKNKRPLKYCVFGKGWYYDDMTNEYTWYHCIYDDIKLNINNNPVGGDMGFQESSEGYIENNYIAKYIPFQKFNLSFLYENIRADSGIKVYLSPTLPSSRPLESSIYNGQLYYPSRYYVQGSNEYIEFLNNGGRLSLVVSSSQTNRDGLPMRGGLTFSFEAKKNIYAPIYESNAFLENKRSTSLMDPPESAISNNIFVDDMSTGLIELRVNITLRHTYVGDLVINLRAPNGKVINLKAQGSGESFNDLRKITFTSKIDYVKMKGLNWWPNGNSRGYIWDPIGVPVYSGNTIIRQATASYPLTSSWLPAATIGAPFGSSAYNFNWSQIRIIDGLIFQMDKSIGQGSPLVLSKSTEFSNVIDTSGITQSIDFRSNVNDLKYLLNDDGSFNGTYSLYIKDYAMGDSGLLEDWNIEFIYKTIYTPILSLTQSDPSNSVNQGAPKQQYLFGLEGNQYIFIVGDKSKVKEDPYAVRRSLSGVTSSVVDLKPTLKNLKIDGGFHSGNNELYGVNDEVYGDTSISQTQIQQPVINTQIITTVSPTFTDSGSGGANTFELNNTIENISYSTYVGTGNLNDPSTLSLKGVSAKIGNGKFMSGIWENGAWNSGWRKDENLQEFYDIDQFFSYNKDKTWRFSIFGSKSAASKFSVGDKVSIGNIVAINVNEERKLIKSYFTIVAKTIDSVSVEFDSDFPIRRIQIDSASHRIYMTKNIWLSGAFLNGYFTGIWNNGLFKGFPYITEMFNTHWIDGNFEGGHFYSRKKSIKFTNTYLAMYNTMKVGLIFDGPHLLAKDDVLRISSTFSTFGYTKVLSVVDDYKVIVDIDWNLSKDPNTYGSAITGTINTNISTGLIQNFNFNANNVSPITSLQSMDSTRVFMYDSWIDVTFDNGSAVNIGKPQSTIDNSISAYSYSENNLYGYPTYDVLSSEVNFRDSFSDKVRNYRLGSKYKIYNDYIGDAGSFDEHFDITGWATKYSMYKSNTPPFVLRKRVGEVLPTSKSFLDQGWVINVDSATGSAISFERTTEALNAEDVGAGKEMKVDSIGKGGVINIQPAYGVPNRTNTTIDKLRYTIVKFDLLKVAAPDFIFEDNTGKYTEKSKYQPLIHFNNLNYATRKVYTPGVGFADKILDSTYLPIYKNINHVETENMTKIEYFYNKRNLSMSFRGSGLNGHNISQFILDNMSLYEVDMIPFFQYFNNGNINKSVSVPYQAVAPFVEYVENDYSLIDNSIYGLDSFNIFQPTNESFILGESAVAAATLAAELAAAMAEAELFDPAAMIQPDELFSESNWGTNVLISTCLVENTSIEMADGSFKMVQDIIAGDSLRSIAVDGMPVEPNQWFSWSDENMTFDACVSNVESNNSFEVGKTIKINDVLETSPSHNNVIKRNGQWIIRKTEDLEIGDILLDSLSNEITIDSINMIDAVAKVYNIMLLGSKLYFANGILTHNKRDEGTISPLSPNTIGGAGFFHHATFTTNSTGSADWF